MDDHCASSLSVRDNRNFIMYHLLNVSYLGLKLCAQLTSKLIILHCRCCKKRRSKSSSQFEISNATSITPSTYSTHSSNGRSLKEEALEIEEKAILADETDKPSFQNTAYCKHYIIIILCFFISSCSGINCSEDIG